MTSLVSLKFDELFTVTIDGKVWTRAKEVVQSALAYKKDTSDTIRKHCSQENYTHKWQLMSSPAAGEVKWPSNSQKYDLYMNEEGVYELAFSSQQLKAKAFRRYCCNELFPRVRKLIVDKMIEKKQRSIDEKDMQIALLDDDLTESQDLVRQLEFSNTGMQGEIRAKDQQIAHLQQQYVPLLEDESKNYGMTIIAKNDESAGYPFISICGQHGYRKQKKRVVLLKNPGSTEFADGSTPNAIVTYNMWREHGLIETDPARPRDFRLVSMENEQLLQIV